MKKLFFLLLLVGGFVFSQTVPPSTAIWAPSGSLCDVGANAAATLLVPYFEVDSQNNLGIDTLVGIVNIGDRRTVAHVTVWNVDSLPVLDFNIYLTPFDVVTFSMRDILVNGNLPNNACPSATYTFTAGWVDCNGDGRYFGQDSALIQQCLRPYGVFNDIACYTTLGGSFLDTIRCFLSIGSYDGWNINYVGYMTIDNSLTCSGAYPWYQCYYPMIFDVDPAVAGVDHGVMENANVLVGDIIYYDYANMQSDGTPAVHIEAFGEANTCTGHTWGMTPAALVGAGVITFYNKYNIWFAGTANRDLREPLPVWWAFRYIGNAAFDGGTWVDVWRSHYDGWGPYAFAGPCFWPGFGGIYTLLYDYVHGLYGLHRPDLVVYDEEENTLGGGTGPSGPWGISGFDALYLESQRTQVSEANTFPLPGESGWIAIAFDTDSAHDLGFGYGSSWDQSWVNVRYSALNRYTVGFSATAWLNGCALVWNAGIGGFVPTPTH